jgi:hypothetical protein
MNPHLDLHTNFKVIQSILSFCSGLVVFVNVVLRECPSLKLSLSVADLFKLMYRAKQDGTSKFSPPVEYCLTCRRTCVIRLEAPLGSLKSHMQWESTAE